MMKFFNKFKNSKGNSLAEFAVTAAMMATLATTAAPRFSGVGEAGKANQTKQNLDKIGGMVNQFFMNTSAPYSPTNRLGEGQGRVPGQTKYDVQVGGYSNLDELMLDLTPTYADDGSIESLRSIVAGNHMALRAMELELSGDQFLEQLMLIQTIWAVCKMKVWAHKPLVKSLWLIFLKKKVR